MGRPKKSRWNPQIFLIPNTYPSASYPTKDERDGLQNEGYGRCSTLQKDGLQRSWTVQDLVNNLMDYFPHRKAELDKTGVELGKVQQGSRKIIVHKLDKRKLVSDLEKHHGQGILVILQKGSTASPKKVSTQFNRPPHVNSPKKCLDGKLQEEVNELADSHGLKIAHQNINSLYRKIDALRQVIQEGNIDVMAISETKVKPQLKNDKLKIPGYTLMGRKDGKRNPGSNTDRGGVLMYVKDRVARSARERWVELAEGLEAGCIDIQGERGNVLRIVVVYIPGSFTSRLKCLHLTMLQESLNELEIKDTCKCSLPECGRSKTKYVILGDFNCNQKNPEKAPKEKLCQLENTFGLRQLIRDLTRVMWQKEKGGDTYEKKESLIDLVFTNYNKANILASGVVHTYMSDHFMVYCSLRW